MTDRPLRSSTKVEKIIVMPSCRQRGISAKAISNLTISVQHPVLQSLVANRFGETKQALKF